MLKRLEKLLREVKLAFITPTIKQKEAMGKFCHTLSSASFIGFVTVLHLGSEPTWYIAKRAMALFASSVILFVVGSMMSKGE